MHIAIGVVLVLLVTFTRFGRYLVLALCMIGTATGVVIINHQQEMERPAEVVSLPKCVPGDSPEVCKGKEIFSAYIQTGRLR